MTADPGIALSLENLGKRYGKQVALDGLNLRVPTGVVYGFLGPNGAGKTTTMRILTGLIHADSGHVEVLGRPFGRGDRKRLFDVGALIESPSFYPFLSARENLRALAATGAPVPKGRIDELLGMVALGDRAKDKVSGYSLGMKQRLGIAAALLNDPKLLLLDEPANGLDPAGIVGMRDTLRALAASGKTVFVSSHILSEIQQMADVVGIIGRGRLIREGTVESLLREEGSIRIRVAPGEVATAAGILAAAAGSGSVTPEDGPEAGWLAVRVDPGRSADLNRALAGAGVFASRIEGAANLESLFLELTGTAVRHRRRSGRAARAARSRSRRSTGAAVRHRRLPAPERRHEAGARERPQARPAAGQLRHVPPAPGPDGPALPRADREHPADDEPGGLDRGPGRRDVPGCVRADGLADPGHRRPARRDLRRGDRRLGVDVGHAQGGGRPRREPVPVHRARVRRGRGDGDHRVPGGVPGRRPARRPSGRRCSTSA